MKTLNCIAGGLALLATILVASNRVSAATTSYHGTGLNAGAYCYDYDDITQANTYVSAYFYEDKQRVSGGATTEYTYGSIYYASYQYSGSEVEVSYGSNDVTDWSIDGLNSAAASATITLYCYIYNYETGEYTDLGTKDVTVDVSLTGVGKTSKSRYSYSYVDPSHYNYTYNSNGQSRQGTSAFLIDGQIFTPSANGYCGGYLNKGKWNAKENIHP